MRATQKKQMCGCLAHALFILKVHDFVVFCAAHNSWYFTVKFYTRIHYLLICTKISISTELDLQNDLL